jgi:glutamine amidotransferase|tara:strand:+ start:351 stop:986 length:636 start_codon:yes stop_codon:yes gene_type:complete
MKKITIIDYGCSNILNLVRAINFLGYESNVTHEKKNIINSSHVILPGVGAFGNAIEQIEKHKLRTTILEYTKLNNPLLGICLGMQLLFTTSYEFGVHNGLNLIEGEVVKISAAKGKKIKVPHIGWNEINPNNKIKKWDNKIFDNNLIGKSFYFVHSYIAKTKNPNATIAISDYSEISIPAIVSNNNIFGCQFHPEKSGENGLAVLKKFCEI